MTMRRKSRSSVPRSAAFTLVELMVAMAVTLVLVVMLATIFNSVSKSFRAGLAEIENQATARLVFDVVTRDIQAGAFRGINLTAFRDDSDAAFAFFSGIPGMGGERRLSALLYKRVAVTGTGENEQRAVLTRGSFPIAWDPEKGARQLNFNAGNTAMPDMKPEVANGARADITHVAEGVLQFEYAFVNRVTETVKATGAVTTSATVTPTYEFKTEELTGPDRTRGTHSQFIRVAVAVVSQRGAVELIAADQFDSLVSALALSDAERTSNLNLVGQWEQKFTQPALTASLPTSARQGTRFYERFIAIPST